MYTPRDPQCGGRDELIDLFSDKVSFVGIEVGLLTLIDIISVLCMGSSRRSCLLDDICDRQVFGAFVFVLVCVCL